MSATYQSHATIHSHTRGPKMKIKLDIRTNRTQHNVTHNAN